MGPPQRRMNPRDGDCCVVVWLPMVVVRADTLMPSDDPVDPARSLRITTLGSFAREADSSGGDGDAGTILPDP